ncbi:hypothetical protein FHP25_10375 [Vineibacter terrae]|uniref:Twin-arginine translocation pathway signal n=2 Tax=Vineibacter terrae TaxID=2586908 RepID=A0A5C8PQH2_9HYPH|nr:hypothetical protein [Vineibacter terrae]TXL77161.1 hypothetical protein FHP25_10375 [Vineibacter terrae]
MAEQAQPFVKLVTTTVGDVAALCELTDPAKEMVPSASSAEAYIDSLTKAGLMSDAIRWLAQGLRPRESVWWACLAARAYVGWGNTLPEPDVAALTAAETWVFKPEEENRRAAMAKAQDTGYQSPASWAAIAAFWSGGSMAPPEAPAVPPPQHLIGRAVWGAIMIATGSAPPPEVEKRQRQLLNQGLDIARGGNGQS